MRRLFSNTLLTLSTLCALITVYLWIRSHHIHEHLGTCRTRRYSPNLIAEYRSGLFFSDGQIIWGSGTPIPFIKTGTNIYTPFIPQGGRLPPASQPSDDTFATGLFRGNFDWWTGERDEDFTWGFGWNHTGLVSYPQWDDHHWRITTIPYWFVFVWFIVFPVIVPIARRRRWTVARAMTTLAVTYSSLLALALISVATMPCGVVILLPAMILGATTYVVVGWRRNRRRARQGLCQVCGYDLRATPHQCPECGTLYRPA